jgi:hypothetical protein
MDEFAFRQPLWQSPRYRSSASQAVFMLLTDPNSIKLIVPHLVSFSFSPPIQPFFGSLRHAKEPDFPELYGCRH